MLIRLIMTADDMELTAVLEESGHPELGRDAGTVAGVDPLGLEVAEELADEPVDVLIDFSAPEATVRCACW
jgi:4-hydroxy-tetrahydrodipicolinate reductase